MSFRLLIALSGLALLACSAAQAQRPACYETTSRMRLSCSMEVGEEFHEGFAICANLSDDDEALDCRDEVHADRRDGYDQCFAQAVARNDVCAALDSLGPYDPVLEEVDFLSPEEAAANPNPYFPLIPGSFWVYQAEDETITVMVTGETREIDGVEATIVNDVVTEEGEVIEDTDDYFAQDADGNIWYLGEIARNYEDGYLTDLDGSFVAGEDGAKAGILVFTNPVVGTTYRQEFLLGEAEDIGTVLSVSGTESAEAAACDGQCLVVRDTTPLEPDADESKYYAPGVGLILEIDNESGERVELVDFEIGSADAR
ncbi:MAG: hypothetical protein QNJ40_17850 [Xanthomonadales bacterium]|nr:hypothetical protein [Xanthomonadales bacterium]